MQRDEAVRFSVEFPAGEEMVRRVAALFSKSGNNKSPEHVRWQYLQNCGGGAYSAIVVDEFGTDAAVGSLVRVRAKLGGRQVIACQAVDTMTVQEFRGKGLFSMLWRSANARADEEKIEFVYGFPNEKSAPGFFRNLQWLRRGYPPFLVHVNNVGYLLKVLGGKKLRVPAVFPLLLVRLANKILQRRNHYRVEAGPAFLSTASYDELWASFSADIPSAVIRDSSYIKWRYIDCPRGDYQFISVFRGRVLCAVVVFTVREKHGGMVGYVMDVIYRSGELRAGQFGVGKAIEKLHSAGADIVLAWSTRNSKTRKAYIMNAFFPLPRRLQPIKLSAGVRFRWGSGSSLEGQSLFLSYADSDTV